MVYLLAFITAMAISMAITPIMVRIAPRFGLIDRPGPRKVHVTPIPRVGSVGIVLGSLVPILLWVPMSQGVYAYLIGALILLIFGLWDDAKELGYLIKFLGQIIAVLTVVFYGDIYVTRLPIVGVEAIPAYIGIPFTVIVMVGVINAINTSDGLDGLAGGMSLLSFGCIGYLAFLAEGYLTLTITIGVLGGVFGFLRYNTHPARVFMGDGGSQFLGFTLGFLAILLTHQANPIISPALPALILGLPIIDIIAVVIQRVKKGEKWYTAHKDHIHHRLLRLGFDHYEAVVIIYAIQVFLVTSALFLTYESDLLIFVVYFGVCSMLFLFLNYAERKNWQAHKHQSVSKLTNLIQTIKEHKLFTSTPVQFVALAIPFLFIFVSLWADKIPRDFGIVSAVLIIFLLYFLFVGKKSTIMFQAINYAAAAFIVYLSVHYNNSHSQFEKFELVYFFLLALGIGLAVRYAGEFKFRTTPMDYLVIFVVILASILLYKQPEQADLGYMAVKLIILFYGCELIITRMKSQWNMLNISTLLTLSVLAVRGLY